MCRLYGFHSNENTKVECTLVHAQNALLAQSQSDEIGREHADGWGIGFFENSAPQIEKRSTPAFECLHFSSTAERVFSHTVVSHVRLATVGEPQVTNCHPFQWGQWVFAHNGTVAGIDQLRPGLLADLNPEHRDRILGDTDSELLFHWLITGASNESLITADDCPSLEALRIHIADRILQMDERCQKASPDKAAKLNIVLTNGKVLIATRLRNSLSWVHRHGIHDCEICGIPHVDHSPDKDYSAVVIASEPLSHEPWMPVPDNSIITVDEQIQVQLHRMQKVTQQGVSL